MRRTVVLSGLLVLSLVTGLLGSGAASASADGGHVRRAANAVPGRYIVALRPGAGSATLAADAVASAHGATVTHVYQSALRGFAARMTAAQAKATALDPAVAYVEEDGFVTVSTTQSPATWGLDRIDQRNLPLDNSYTYTPTGAGVTAYIIDTGVLTTHTEFGARASSGIDTIDGALPAQDCHGHGTHVAGTVGGSTYGVAKGVAIVAVRVLDCSGSGTNAQVIAGVDWVTADHGPGEPAVANMSLGGGPSSALDTAVANSIADGVTYSIAAGNDAINACLTSPARVTAALTVGATSSTDTRASFSNYGTCLDIFAPGVSITSAWINSSTDTRTISGTSMAAPHVGGVVALYLEGNPSATPAQVASALSAAATPSVVLSPGTGSPNLLLYADPSSAPPPSSITLSARGKTTARGRHRVTLTWAGAVGPNVDLFRNGGLLAVTTNDGEYKDALGRSTGTFVYQVCESGSANCSNVASVTF